MNDFESKIDPFRKKLSAIPVFVCLILLGLSFILNVKDPGILRFLGGFGGILFTIHYFGLQSCYYNVGPFNIHIYILGINAKTILIKDIDEIRGKNFKTVIYGTSRDAIKLVMTNKDEIAISPLDKEGFIAHLLKKKSDIIVDLNKS